MAHAYAAPGAAVFVLHKAAATTIGFAVAKTKAVCAAV